MTGDAGAYPLAVQLAVGLAAYLLGSIPFGLLLTRAAGLGDIRRIGSGNIGATNVLRTGRRGLAAATLLLDGGKGAVAVLAAERFYPGLGPLAGLAALAGHLVPVWLGFRGGKGVATTLGILLALAPIAGVTACLVWLAVAFVSRYSSLAALVAIGSAPLVAWVTAPRPAALASLGAAVLVIWRHRANIGRLAHGTESRIRLKA